MERNKKTALRFYGTGNSWKVELKTFHSDRVKRIIDEVNFKGEQQALQSKAKNKEKTISPIEISDEGLETI